VDLVRLVAARRDPVSDVDVGVLEIGGDGVLGGSGVLGCGPPARAGAIPHTSQYPSTIWPLH
jgi:hypothetical protein